LLAQAPPHVQLWEFLKKDKRRTQNIVTMHSKILLDIHG
jgi:hypothetical protein